MSNQPGDCHNFFFVVSLWFSEYVMIFELRGTQLRKNMRTVLFRVLWSIQGEISQQSFNLDRRLRIDFKFCSCSDQLRRLKSFKTHHHPGIHLLCATDHNCYKAFFFYSGL